MSPLIVMEEKKQTKIDLSHMAVLLAGVFLGAILMSAYHGYEGREYMGKYARAKVDLIQAARIIENKNEYETVAEWLNDLEKMKAYISENYQQLPKGQKP